MPVGIEEVLFAFLIGGIAAVIYQVVFSKRCERGERLVGITLFVLALTVAAFLVLKHSGFNTIWASTDALFLGASLMIAINRSLFVDSVMSAVLIVALVYPLYWVLFAVFPEAHTIFWVSGGLSDINLLGAPVEEMVWFAAWAMFAGILYRFYKGSTSAKVLL